MSAYVYSFRQELYQKKCRGKHRFASEGAAQSAIRSLLKRGIAEQPENLQAYECNFCGHWHHGHRPGSKK